MLAWKVINILNITMGKCSASGVTLRVGQGLCAVGGAERGGCCIIWVERGGQRRRKLDVGQVRKRTASVVGCWFQWSGQLLVRRREYAAENRQVQINTLLKSDQLMLMTNEEWREILDILCKLLSNTWKLFPIQTTAEILGLCALGQQYFCKCFGSTLLLLWWLRYKCKWCLIIVRWFQFKANLIHTCLSDVWQYALNMKLPVCS